MTVAEKLGWALETVFWTVLAVLVVVTFASAPNDASDPFRSVDDIMADVERGWSLRYAQMLLADLTFAAFYALLALFLLSEPGHAPPKLAMSAAGSTTAMILLSAALYPSPKSPLAPIALGLGAIIAAARIVMLARAVWVGPGADRLHPLLLVGCAMFAAPLVMFQMLHFAGSTTFFFGEAQITPHWFELPAYAVLRALRAGDGVGWLMITAITVAPWLGGGRGGLRGLRWSLAALFFGALCCLGYLGAQPSSPAIDPPALALIVFCGADLFLLRPCLWLLDRKEPPDQPSVDPEVFR
ncbi:MAG: hypothetical protein AAF909_14990 [Pseudomonadota bacterium]